AAYALYLSMEMCLRLRPDLELMRTYYLDGLSMSIDGSPLEEVPGQHGQNTASKRLLEATGYSVFARERVLLPVVWHTVDKQSVGLAPTWAHLFGSPDDICAKSRTEYRRRCREPSAIRGVG